YPTYSNLRGIHINKMFRQILILTYLIVLLLGTVLFFTGFNGEKANYTQSGSFKERFKLLEIESFEVEAIYDRVVYFIVDALRVDYLNIETRNPRNNIHNKFKNLNELMKNVELNKHIRFFNFKAEFPTLTTFRVKSLMSGENPGLLELISALRPKNNTESSTILKNLYLQNKKSAVIGDDTWSLLYDQLIHYNYKYESLDIRDFDNLDEFVKEKSNMFLNHTNPYYKKYNDWKFMVMHFIGVDHIGHYIGIDNHNMSNKLSEMDQSAAKTLQMLLKIDHGKENPTPKEFNQQIQNFTKNSKSEKILFLLFGDHGQNEYGGHGGPCISETSAGLFAFSTIPFINSMETISEWNLPVNNNHTNKISGSASFNERIKNIKVLNQIDVIPIISAALGIPIPENNLGIFHDDFKIHLKKGTGHDYHDPNHFSFHQRLLQEITYAKIMHNNALQIFNRLLSILGTQQRLQNDIKTKYYEFGKSYQLIKNVDLLRIKKENDYEQLISICKNHFQLSHEFASLIQKKLFMDRSKFDWLSIIQGFIILLALLIFVSVIIIPGFNLSMSRFMFNQKKGFLSLSPESGASSSNHQLSITNTINIRSGPLFTVYLILIFLSSTINLIGLYLLNQNLLVSEALIYYYTAFTFTLITLIVMHILIRCRYEIQSFYFNMFKLSLSNKQLRWNFYWCIMALLCLLQFSSYSASFAKNEGKVVKFLLVSYQIILLFSGSKSNLRQMLLPIIQLLLLRFTYIFEDENQQVLRGGFLNFGLLLSSNMTRLFVLLIYLLLLLIVYRNILNRWNMLIIGIAPIYFWFNWIENNNLVRTLALIQVIKIINDLFIKRYRLKLFKESNSNTSTTIIVNDKLIINRWINNHLILIFLLKNELIVPYSISSIIQLISIENLRLDGFNNNHNSRDNIFSIPVRVIESILLLYLLSINNFFNLGNKLKLESIPEYVGFVGLDHFHPIISQLVVIYFLTSHLFSLSILLKLPSLGLKNPRIWMMGILLSKYLFTIFGTIILRKNIMVWQILSPKLIYEFIFCSTFSIYSLY
ncbi:phosphatidylinositol glycan class O, partial [Cryptosporidium sp. chipmunk genotype I]|uniref:phosphatidylinositol glycan class O n=1 Tax=Cryptosporidium sp. chipmunk genotype I TaxID=1280935 RepID=UPI00351A081E